MKKIILASGSPRRRQLLAETGLDFEVRVSHREEVMTGSDPAQTVAALSAMKAEDIADQTEEDAVIIGSDTVVAIDGMILGKPADAQAAFETIRMLSGRTHQVLTGVTLISLEGKTRQTKTFVEETLVTFRELSEAQIKAYIQKGEPHPAGRQPPEILPWKDKAGAYGIQEPFGMKYIEHIRGDYYTVVGLPVCRLYAELEKMRL